ncbi:hypothetical protein ABKT30_09685 [Enterobacter hormaechei]
MAFNENGKRAEVPVVTKLEELLKSSERELVYYVHYLQKRNKTRHYISDVNYADFNLVKKLIRNALYKSDARTDDIDNTINRMLEDYHELAISEENTNWLKGDRRACLWLLFNILIKDTQYEFVRDIINNKSLNTHSDSEYYSILAWIDKEMYSWRHDDVPKKIMNYADDWRKIKINKMHLWLEQKKEQNEIEYCYSYLKDKGMNIILSTMSEREVALIIEFCEASGFSHKDIVIAFFDYIHGYSANGDIVAESLKGKMSSGLSSWKNRKNKEEYSDLHFDIKKENIPKLEELQKILRLYSKKEVVNELIEKFYEQYNKT